jgi:hypothetical protein
MDKIVSEGGELMTIDEAEESRRENMSFDEELLEMGEEQIYSDGPPVAQPHYEATLNGMTNKQIIQLLVALSLKTYGSKKDLIARYKQHFEKKKSEKELPLQYGNKLDGTKGPNWTLNEDLRMLSILSDPSYMLIVRRLCEGVTTRFFFINFILNI